MSTLLIMHVLAMGKKVYFTNTTLLIVCQFITLKIHCKEQCVPGPSPLLNGTGNEANTVHLKQPCFGAEGGNIPVF